jgi:hypothetical protein
VSRFADWIAKLWRKPIPWEIRTDDRRVRLGQLRQRVLAVGGFRAWQYVPPVETPERPFRPLWVDVPASSELHINPMFEGKRLGQLGEEFRRSRVADRALTQLTEMVDRIEVAADRMWAQLLEDVGAPSQGWAT